MAMRNFRAMSRYGVVLCFLLLGALCGCSQKPSSDEVSRLEEARNAAIAAEKKLAELRKERIALEEQLKQKSSELKKQQDERDGLKK